MWHISTLCQTKYKGLKHTKLAVHVGKSVLLPCRGQCVSPGDRCSKFLSSVCKNRLILEEGGEEEANRGRNRLEEHKRWLSQLYRSKRHAQTAPAVLQHKQSLPPSQTPVRQSHSVSSQSDKRTVQSRRHPWLRFNMCDWCWRNSVFYSEVLFSPRLKFHGRCSFFVWCWQSHSAFWRVAFVG